MNFEINVDFQYLSHRTFGSWRPHVTENLLPRIKRFKPMIPEPFWGDFVKSKNLKKVYLVGKKWLIITRRLKGRNEYRSDIKYRDAMLPQEVSKFLNYLLTITKLTYSINLQSIKSMTTTVKEMAEEIEAISVTQAIKESRHASEESRESTKLKSIECSELLKMEESGGGILIVDVRTNEEFKRSKITHEECVNIPGSLLRWVYN